MSDLASLSDSELQALYKPKAAPDFSKMSDEELKAAYEAKNPGIIGTAADVAKSAGIGLAKGGIGMAGMAGDLSDLGAKGIEHASNFISDKLGMERYKRPEQPSVLNNIPTSAGIQKGIEGYTGEFYKPKTTAGEYAQTAGEFAPALVGGEGSLLAKALTRVAAPAIASETAGQAAKDTALEPWARVAGGLLGGGAASIGGKASSVAPTIDELKSAARTNYQSPIVKALEINPASPAKLSDDILSHLTENMGMRASDAPSTFSKLQELKSPLGPTSKVADIDSVRKSLGVTAKDYSKPADANAAREAIKRIDDYLPNINPSDVVAGNASEASRLLTEARANWGAASRSKDIAKALNNAEINTGAAYSGGNINNATRQSLKPILKDKTNNSLGGYIPEEVDQLRTAVNGTMTGNVLRGIGKVGPNGGLMGGLHLAEAINTGGASLPVSAIGYAAKKLGDASASRQANKLDEMLRSRSPLAEALNSSLPAMPNAAPRMSLLAAALMSANSHEPTRIRIYPSGEKEKQGPRS